MHLAASEFYGAGAVIFIQIHFNTIEALFIADHAERGAINVSPVFIGFEFCERMDIAEKRFSAIEIIMVSRNII